jgi:hypothetical protein
MVMGMCSCGVSDWWFSLWIIVPWAIAV